MSFLYPCGYQKSMGKAERIKINPNLLLGSLSAVFVKNVPDKYYSIKLINLYVHYGLLKYSDISLVTSVGVFISYYSGLTGTGGNPSRNSSSYFRDTYNGRLLSLGFRITPKRSRFAYELNPINVNNTWGASLLLFYPMLKLDIRLYK